MLSMVAYLSHGSHKRLSQPVDVYYSISYIIYYIIIN